MDTLQTLLGDTLLVLAGLSLILLAVILLLVQANVIVYLGDRLSRRLRSPDRQDASRAVQTKDRSHAQSASTEEGG